MKQPRIPTAGSVILGAALLILSSLNPIYAAPGEEEIEGHRGFMAAKGRVTYRAYCSNCHGAAGTGNGNLAQYLTVSPTDLTLLAHDNGGQFPTDLVRQAIDARKEVRGHGSKEMPVWGDVFQSSLSEHTPASDETGEERARRKITELVLYLETLQGEQQPGTQVEE